MLAKDNNDIPMLQSNRAMEKAQEIAQKILKTTPHLIKRTIFSLFPPYAEKNFQVTQCSKTNLKLPQLKMSLQFRCQQ